MTKAELVASVSKSTGIEKAAVAATLESILETIKDSITHGEPVYMRGFGTFGIKHRAAKRARNITKNTTLLVPEKDIPAFKPSKEFKSALNK